MDGFDRASILVRENDKKPLILNFTDEEMELKMHSAFGTMDARPGDYQVWKRPDDRLQPEVLGDALRIIDDEGSDSVHDELKSPCFIRDEEETLHLSDPAGQFHPRQRSNPPFLDKAGAGRQ